MRSGSVWVVSPRGSVDLRLPRFEHVEPMVPAQSWAEESSTNLAKSRENNMRRRPGYLLEAWSSGETAPAIGSKVDLSQARYALSLAS